MDKRSAPMEPILRDIPESFESERRKIRPPRQGDGQLVFDDVRESLADLRRFPASMLWALAEPSMESSEKFCREAYSNLSPDVIYHYYCCSRNRT